MAAQAPPLPTPQPSEASNPLALALTSVSRAVPNQDPEVSAGIATNSTSPDQAVQTAQAAQGFVDAANLAKQLRQESGENQRAAWAQLPATQQQTLQAAGYKPPSAGRSWFGTVTHALGTGVHDTLNAARSPLRAVQHGIRTVFAGANQSADPNSVGYSWMLHPSDWARAWNESANGEHYILPSVQAQVQKQYGETTYQAALQLAYGKAMPDIVTSTPQAQQQQVAETLMSPEVRQAVTALQAGKITEGKMLAYQVLGLKASSTAGNLISGSTDALIDWRGDPTVIGSKMAASYNVARYFVRDGSDIHRLFEANQSVRDAMGDIASHMSQEKPDIAGLLERYPYMAGMVDQLSRANIQTAEDVRDFFADELNINSLLSARPASLPGHVEGGILPHLSNAGVARLALKGQLQKAIDWAADRPATIEGLQPGDTIDHPLTATGPVDRLVTTTGRSIRHLLTLTPQGDSFNPYAENWFNKLRDVAMMSLPRARANQLLNDYASEATIGGRRNIYAGMLKEVFAAAGVDHVPGVDDWAKSVLDPDNFEAVASHQSYGPGGIDLVSRAGTQRPAAVLRGQLSDEWAMPNYKTLYAQVKKAGVLRATNGALNNQMVDKFMSQIWKPLALARFGFSLRVAGEEAFGMLLRNGPAQALRARAAASAIARLSDDGTEDGMLGRTWDRLTAHLPETVRTNITTPVDLVAAHVGDYTNRALAGVEGRLAGSRYMDAARMMASHGVLDPDGAFGRYISAGEEHAGSFYDAFMSTGRPRVRVWDHGRMVNARMVQTGAWTEYKPTAQVFTHNWYKRLREIATDPWGRTALRTRDLEMPDRIQAVADRLKADPQWLASERSQWTRDERRVGVDATTDEAASDHAKAIVDLVDSYTHSVTGEEVPGLADHLLANRRPPTLAALDEVGEADRPAAVSGPELVPSLSGLTGAFSNGVNAMFGVIGKQIDWISRQPMFVHNFAISVDAYRPMAETWARMGMSPEEVESALVKAATDRAIHLTTPYIHNPQLRSQFAVITRNVAPFWFAQEQFYKRWARTMTFAPWAFRQAQLISQGVYHSGFTHTDPTSGQRYFVYPGAGAVQDVLTKSLGVFGYDAYLPIEANLRGQVKMASPGLERLGLPNVGPAVIVPLKLVQSVFPETDALDRTTASQSYSSALVPSTVSRIWQDFTSTPNNSPQYASAMMQAIQYLEATGHGIGQVATNNRGTWQGTDAPTVTEGQGYQPGDYLTDQANRTWVMQADGAWRRNDPAALTSYMARVKNWTRVFLITRTIFGFNAPASPENLFDPSNVNEDFQSLLKTLPYNEAVAAFMKLHPDASAYTVFQTKNQAGAPLPATAAAMQFMDANGGFFGAHPLAGSFFIPQQDATGKFSRQAYLAQLQEQLRVRRTPGQFWQEVAYTNAATKYFAAEATKNTMLNAGGQSRNAIDAAWTAESQQFLKANPLFAQQLADSGGAYTRANIEQDLAGALGDPRLPETPQTENIRTLYNSFVTYQAMTAPYGMPGANTMSAAQRYRIEVEYAAQVQAWVASHPDTLPVYQRLIQPALSGVLNTEANAAA